MEIGAGAMVVPRGGPCSLKQDEPWRIGTSRFLPQCMFVFYKFLFAVYTIGWIVFWEIEVEIVAVKFVTFWQWYTIAIYFVLSFLTAVQHGRGDHASRRRPLGSSSGCGCSDLLASLQMAFWYASCTASLVVVLIFWVFLYEGGPATTIDINAHSLSGALMILDQFLVATQHRLWALWPSWLFSGVYLAFNVGFFFLADTDDNVIYKILDWGEDPTSSSIFALIIFFVLIPLFHGFHHGLYRHHNISTTWRIPLRDPPQHKPTTATGSGNVLLRRPWEHTSTASYLATNLNTVLPSERDYGQMWRMYDLLPSLPRVPTWCCLLLAISHKP